jgi:hypothetical protein
MRSEKEREAAICACLPTDPYLATVFVEAMTFAYVHSDEKTDTSTEIRFRVGRQLSTPDALRLKSVSYDRATQTFRIKLAHEYKINSAELVSFRLYATTKIRDFSSGGADLMFEVRGEGDKPVDWLGCINYWHPNSGIQIQQVKEPCWWSKGTRRVRKDWQNEEYGAQMRALRQQWKADDEEIARSERLVPLFFSNGRETCDRLLEQLQFCCGFADSMRTKDAPAKATRVEFGLAMAPRDAHTVPIRQIVLRPKQGTVEILFGTTVTIRNISMSHVRLRLRAVPGDEPAVVFDDDSTVPNRHIFCVSQWVPAKGIVARPHLSDDNGCIVTTVKWTNESYVEGPAPTVELVAQTTKTKPKRKIGKDDIADEEQIERPADVKRARA